MKKSKIIVPALAMIAFSTAASIAGSVAWFTASRTVTINAGDYSVVKINSDLKYSLAGGAGTTVSGNNVSFNGKLSDGSFNHLAEKIYTPATDGKSIVKETALSANDLQDQMYRKKAGDGVTNIYTAATFDITFTIDFGAGDSDKALYLDCSSLEKSAFTYTGTLATAAGFRMAFIPKGTAPTGSSQYKKVFAPLQAKANCKYVAGLDNWAGTEYGDGVVIDSAFWGAHGALPDPTAEGQTIAKMTTQRLDCLGVFHRQNDSIPEVNLAYTVVCWFDGNDPEIVNRASLSEYQTVSSKLVFEAVDLPNA